MVPRKVTDASRRNDHKRTLARGLCRKATDAERKLWSLLRNKQLSALRFRRQQPIGPYIADFFCSPAKLIVELDGGQHNEESKLEYDERRTRFLSERGDRVIRFVNQDVLFRADAVVEGIWIAAAASGRPLREPPRGGSTLPQGEG